MPDPPWATYSAPVRESQPVESRPVESQPVAGYRAHASVAWANGTTQPRRETPPEVDSFRPSAARMYDYYLGGTNHLAADREAADALLAAVPDVADTARANREFLRRVVEYATSHGVRQFLDLGAGFALAGGVSDVALAAEPDARIVAVDIDPSVVAQIQSSTRADDRTNRVGAVHADLRDAVGILQDPVTRRMLDPDQPVAILCLSVLHFVNGDLRRVLDPLRQAVTGGSLLAISHATTAPAPSGPPGLNHGAVARLIYDCTLTPLTLRTRTELDQLLIGLEVIGPGIVPVNQWGATAHRPVPSLLGAVARLP